MRLVYPLTLALVVVLALGYPAEAMNARGERILIFGDSLTQHASGGNPVWDVNAGPQRASSAPGDLLASLLLDQGATVRTNALVSRSAFNFWTREDAAKLIAADLAWKPTKIVFVLGTNDVGLAPGPDEAAFVRLRDAYQPAKAEIWAIGPFTSRLPAAGVEQVVTTMRKVFGPRFLDGRPLSAMISPGSDGVHYTPTSARLLALNLADALLSAATVKPWVGAAIGAAVVVGGGLIYGLAMSSRRGLAGLEIVDGKRWDGSTSALVRSGYKPVPCKSGLDAKGLARCWSRGTLGAPVSYRLIYLTAGKRSVAPEEFASVEAATRAVRTFKARGWTAWVEDDTGQFVPVKGAQRRPRGLGAAEAPMDAAAKRLVTRTRKLIATLAAGDYADMNGATDLMVKINDATLKLERAGHPDVATALQAEKGAAVEAGQAARSARLAEDARRAREEHREAERTRPDAWMRGRRGLHGDDDDDEPRPGEDDETWWRRIMRRAKEGESRVRDALEHHDALIITARGGRRILVLKTPEMSNPHEGALRITTFDEDGPIGHQTRATVAQLADEVYRDWHPEAITLASEAEVMAWTGTERFAKGAAAVAEMQRRNVRSRS